MAVENVHDFAGYEPTTIDPGGRLTLIVVIACILVNLTLPVMVRIAASCDGRKAKEKAVAAVSGEEAEAEHREELSEMSKPTWNTRSPAPAASPLSIYQVATRTSSSEGSFHPTPSVFSEGARSVLSTKSTASSSVLSLAASTILDQRMSKSPRKRRKYRADINLSPTHNPVSPRRIDPDDDVSVSSKSVMSILDQDAVSIQDAVDARDGHMLDARLPKLLEQDEPSSLWIQFLEIADWDAESKRLTVLTIPYTIQGCTEGIFQTINVAIIGHYLGVMEANAYVVVTILLEFSQTLTYGFGEAVGTLVPHADGAGNDVLAGRYLQLAIIMYTITSIPAVFVWSFYTDEVVLWFGFDEATAAISQRFAYSFLVNVFLSGLDHGIHEFLNVTGHEKYSTVVQILYYAIQTVSVIVSVSLGLNDLFYVGLVQAFLAVLMSLSNFVFVVYRGWLDKYWEGFAQTLSVRDGRALRTMMVTAIPLSIAWLLTYGEWELLTIFASSMGPAEVATWGMLGFIWDVFEHLTAGFADAAECRVGFRMGAGQPHSAKIAAYKSIYMGVVVSVMSTGGLFIISAYLPGWLTPDPTLQRMIFECLPLIGFGQILMIVGTVTWGVVGAQGRIRLATIVEFISSWFIAIPFCVISLYVLNYNLLGFVASLIFGYTVGGVAMGFIILRSDWNALSQSVIARNTIEGVTWEDNDWEELPPHVQRAALCLGYSKHIWNDDQDPPSNDRDWDELTPQEKEAAKIMGFNRNKWDDGSDTSDGESKSDEKGKYDSLSWNDLPSDAKIAAKKLGYSRKLWDSDKEPASSDRQWSELNPTEQEAALILGYDRKKWDGQSENGQEKQEQKIAKSNEEGRKSPVDHAQEATAKLPETGISQLVSSSQEDQITQRTDSRSNFEDMSWNDLPSDVQAAAKTLGYDSKMWDDDKSPPSDNKSWHKLTTEEKIAAKMLGYDQRTWDDDSSSDSSSDGQDQQSESNDKKARFDEMAWKDLPSHVRAAAKTLGYDSKMWDKNGSPPTDDKWWHKLTANEQRAAQTLGYTEKSWNDDSSSSSE